MGEDGQFWKLEAVRGNLICPAPIVGLIAALDDLGSMRVDGKAFDPDVGAAFLQKYHPIVSALVSAGKKESGLDKLKHVKTEAYPLFKGLIYALRKLHSGPTKAWRIDMNGISGTIRAKPVRPLAYIRPKGRYIRIASWSAKDYASFSVSRAC
jgi:hypothetical protein